MAAQQMSRLDAFAYQLFQFLDTEQRNQLGGSKIFPLFSSSGLPKNLLARTWEISTRGTKGLNPSQFSLALKIISLSQNGIPVNQMKSRIGDHNIPIPKMTYPPQLAHLLQPPANPQQAPPVEVQPKAHGADPFGFGDLMSMSGIGRPKPQAVVAENSVIDKPQPTNVPTTQEMPRPQPAMYPLDTSPKQDLTGAAAGNIRRSATLPTVAPNARLHQQPMGPPNMFLPPMANTMMPTPIQPQVAVQRASVSPPQERKHIDTDADRLREIAAAADLREKQARKQANTAREENERIVRENQVLKQQIESCRQAESDALRRANDVLQKMSPMQVENAQLKEGIEAWRKRVEEQLERNKQLEEEIVKLRTEMQENSTRLNTLTLENQELRKRFESSEEATVQLRDAKEKFTKENMELKQKLNQELRKNEALEFDIKELESRNVGLKPLDDRTKAPISMDARDTEAALFDSGFKALAGQHVPAVEKTEKEKDVVADFLIDFTQKEPEPVEIKPTKVLPVAQEKSQASVEMKQKDAGTLFPSDLVKTRAAKDAYNGFGPAEVAKKDTKAVEASTSPSVIQMGVVEPNEGPKEDDIFAGLADFTAPVAIDEQPVKATKPADVFDDFDFGAAPVEVNTDIQKGPAESTFQPKSSPELPKPDKVDERKSGFSDDFGDMSFEFNPKPAVKPSRVTPGGDFSTPGNNFVTPGGDFEAGDFEIDFPEFDDDFGGPAEVIEPVVTVKKTLPAPAAMKEPEVEPEAEPELEAQPPAPVVTQADKTLAIEEPADDDLRMTAKDRDIYIPFFDQADTNKDGIVDGKEALKFFTKSSVKKKVLAAIWKLVDTEDSGHLTRTKFYIMMHMVVKYKQDKSIVLPKKLPYYLEPAYVDNLGKEEGLNEIAEQDSNIVVPEVQDNKGSEQSTTTSPLQGAFDSKTVSKSASPDATTSGGKKTKKKKKKKKKASKTGTVSPRPKEAKVEEAVSKDAAAANEWDAEDNWDVNFDETPGGVTGEKKEQVEKFDDFNFDNGGAFDAGFDDPAQGFDPF